MKIEEYFEEVENELNSCPLILSVEFKTEAIDLEVGYYKAKAVFTDGSELHLFEYVDLEEGVIDKYRYHYQDREGQTVYKWDNARHHEEVETFPDHLHEGGEVKESEKPEVGKVLRKVMELMEKK